MNFRQKCVCLAFIIYLLTLCKKSWLHHSARKIYKFLIIFLMNSYIRLTFGFIDQISMKRFVITQRKRWKWQKIENENIFFWILKCRSVYKNWMENISSKKLHLHVFHQTFGAKKTKNKTLSLKFNFDIPICCKMANVAVVNLPCEFWCKR